MCNVYHTYTLGKRGRKERGVRREREREGERERKRKREWERERERQTSSRPFLRWLVIELFVAKKMERFCDSSI